MSIISYKQHAAKACYKLYILNCTQALSSTKSTFNQHAVHLSHYPLLVGMYIAPCKKHASYQACNIHASFACERACTVKVADQMQAGSPCTFPCHGKRACRSWHALTGMLRALTGMRRELFARRQLAEAGTQKSTVYAYTAYKWLISCLQASVIAVFFDLPSCTHVSIPLCIFRTKGIH